MWRGNTLSDLEVGKNPLGVHLVASIDADLYRGLVRYCAARQVPLSRAVNNALSLYFTRRPRPEKPRRACSQVEGIQKLNRFLGRKVPLSVHVDVDLVVLAEEYCAFHRVYLSSVVNRALALWLHRVKDERKKEVGTS